MAEFRLTTKAVEDLSHNKKGQIHPLILLTQNYLENILFKTKAPTLCNFFITYIDLSRSLQKLYSTSCS